MPGRHEPGLRYRPDVDGLRALAVAAVVLYHAFPGTFHGGFTGVDVFFVISGYLISSLIWTELGTTGGFRFGHFYARRVIRLFPALTVVVAACLVGGWWLLLPHDYSTLGKDAIAAAGYVSNIVFWQESGYFDGAASLRPFTHLWSLAVEEQFYLVYPLILVLCFRRRWTRFILPGLLAGSFALNLAWSQTHPQAAFYLLPTRFWELLLGGLLAYTQFARPGSWERAPGRVLDAAGLLGAGLIAVALFGPTSSSRYPGWWALVPTIGATLAIGAGPQALLSRALLTRERLVQIGLISYPIYLWHFPLFAFARLQTPGRELSVWLSLALIAASVALAALTYRLVEQPIRIRRRRRTRRMVPALVAVLAVAGLLGVVVTESSGFPSRFPFPAQRLLTYTYDFEREYREGTCSLDPDQGPGSFAKTCVDPGGTAGGPVVALWGDSRAAHLYPGLRSLRRTHRFRIAEFASSSCPPFLGYRAPARPHCPAINPFVLEKIRQLKPATVVLSAAWDQYPQLNPLRRTVSGLRAAGVRAIVVMGPSPKWRDGLPQALYEVYRRNPAAGIPSRLAFGLHPGPQAVDAPLRALARELHVTYLDPLRAMCNRKGCLARVGNRIDEITVWDSQHLTTAGSTFLVTKFERQLMSEVARR